MARATKTVTTESLSAVIAQIYDATAEGAELAEGAFKSMSAPEITREQLFDLSNSLGNLQKLLHTVLSLHNNALSRKELEEQFRKETKS